MKTLFTLTILTLMTFGCANKGSSKLKEGFDIMIEQIRAIDKKRLLKGIGDLDQQQTEHLWTNLSIILDF